MLSALVGWDQAAAAAGSITRAGSFLDRPASFYFLYHECQQSPLPCVPGKNPEENLRPEKSPSDATSKTMKEQVRKSEHRLPQARRR